MFEAREPRKIPGLKISFRVLMLLGSGLVYVVALWPLSQQSSSPSTLSEQQGAGRRLFMQNCSFCHLPKGNPKSPVKTTTIGPVLDGLFRGEKPRSEEAVRAFIQYGVPQKMPGFQYGLESKEIDQIIAYLKTL